MELVNKKQRLIVCITLVFLELFIILFSYFYVLFDSSLNWASYLFYFISWWSVQTDLIILFFATFGIINILQPKLCSFSFNQNFLIYILFACILTCLFFTTGTIVGALSGEIFASAMDNVALYWITTILQHWICPAIFIIFFIKSLTTKKIEIKEFYLKKLYKYYLHPLIYTIFIAIREGILLSSSIDQKLWDYSAYANNYYVPYFFQDFRRVEYYILYLIILTLIVFLLVSLIVNVNNKIVAKKSALYLN